tara:strand:+ start:60056 stop:60256 length:201 start_codon:yes stop_codon:yes gene_type:complete
MGELKGPAPGLQHFSPKEWIITPMKQRGPWDLHFLIRLREKNSLVGAVFFAIGVLFFGYLFIVILA